MLTCPSLCTRSFSLPLTQQHSDTAMSQNLLDSLCQLLWELSSSFSQVWAVVTSRFLFLRALAATGPHPQVLPSRDLNRSRASAIHYLQPAPVRGATGTQQEEAGLSGCNRFFTESRRTSGSSRCEVWCLTTEQKSGI